MKRAISELWVIILGLTILEVLWPLPLAQSIGELLTQGL